MSASGVRSEPFGRIWRIPVAALLLLSFWGGLNHDVRYALGCLRAAGRGGHSMAETFVHRPLAYRWLLGGLDYLTAGPVVVREALIRLLVVAAVAATAIWLRAALSQYLPRGEATAVAAGAGLALALAPAWDFLQPEWVAAELATAAVAAALWFRRGTAAALAGGTLLALVVLVKYTTAPVALIALGVIAAVHRRRALSAAAAAVPLTAVLFGVSVLVEPREWRWLWELPNLNTGTPMRVGFGQAAAEGLVSTLVNEALLVPAFALLPVSTLLLARMSGRYAWPALSAGAVLCMIAALIVQGQWFLYHLAALPVFASGLLALAMVRWARAYGRPPAVPVVAAGVLGIAVPLVTAAPLAWRQAHGWLVYGMVLALVLATFALAVRARRTAPAVAALLAGLLTVAVPAWPSSPYTFDSRHAGYTPLERAEQRQRTEEQLAQVRDRIGADTPVTYLAFGDVAYFLGNPSRCRYPSPVFLQRTQFVPEVRELASFKEAMGCFDEGNYLIVDTQWFPLGKVDAQVRERARKLFDCDIGAFRTGSLLVCPRR